MKSREKSPKDVFSDFLNHPMEPIMKSTRFSRKILLVTAVLAATLGAVSVEAGGGRYRFQQDNTPGWTLMTPAERTEFQTRMRAAKTYDECKAIQAEHHAAVEARAKEKGVTLNGPRYNACDQMKARGFLK
ncbi:MAG: hypothetical protein ACUVSD_12390 [Thiobacillaceae bacterium]